MFCVRFLGACAKIFQADGLNLIHAMLQSHSAMHGEVSSCSPGNNLYILDLHGYQSQLCSYPHAYNTLGLHSSCAHVIFISCPLYTCPGPTPTLIPRSVHSFLVRLSPVGKTSPKNTNFDFGKLNTTAPGIPTILLRPRISRR